MANYWIKLYHEILHDPKMGKLPDRTWRRCIELFLLAGETGKDGELPSFDDICWKLRVDSDTMQDDLDKLSRLGIVTNDAEAWTVTKFMERQDPDTPKERLQRFRDRKHSGNANETQMKQNVSDDVTKSVPDKNRVDIDKNRVDIEIEKDRETTAAIFTTWESNVGIITPIIADTIKDWLDTFSSEMVSDAIIEAVNHNKRNVAYITAILKNWQEKGRGDNRKNGNGKGELIPGSPEDRARYTSGKFADVIQRAE